MVFFTAALIAAPIVYEIVKHYEPRVGKPIKKLKEVTGFAKLEKEQPELALGIELGIDYAVFKGAGKIGKAPKIAKAAQKTRKARSVSKSISAARKKNIIVAGGKGTHRVSVAKVSLKGTTKFTISKGTLASGKKVQTVHKTRRVNKFTGETVRLRSGRKYQSARSLAQLTKASAKATGKGIFKAGSFAKRHPRFIIQSWALQDALINLNLLNPESDLFF